MFEKRKVSKEGTKLNNALNKMKDKKEERKKGGNRKRHLGNKKDRKNTYICKWKDKRMRT